MLVLTQTSMPSVKFQMGFSIRFSAVMQPWSRPVCGPASATVCVSAGGLRRRWRCVALFSVHHMFPRIFTASHVLSVSRVLYASNVFYALHVFCALHVFYASHFFYALHGFMLYVSLHYVF